MQSQLKQELYQKSDMYLYLDFVPNGVSQVQENRIDKICNFDSYFRKFQFVTEKFSLY